MSATILDAVRSLVTAPPFALQETPALFDFDRVPAQLEGDSVRVEMARVQTVGGFAFSEEAIDDLEVWVAFVVDQADPRASYRHLQVLASSLTSAIVRLGTGAGDFAVPDTGRRMEIAQPPGAAYQMLRLTVPVDYMVTL
jgi:hypothetical protein